MGKQTGKKVTKADAEEVPFVETKDSGSVLDGDFMFEDSPSSLDSPIQRPLAGETEQEGGSLAEIISGGGNHDAFTNPDFIEKKEPVKPASSVSIKPGGDTSGPVIPENKTAQTSSSGGGSKKPPGHGYDKFSGGFGNIPPAPPPPGAGIPGMDAGMGGGGNNLADDYKEIPFIEDDDIDSGGSSGGGMTGGGGGIKVPDELAKSNAKRIAKFIVDTEENFLMNYFRNRAKVNVLEIKRHLTLNQIPPKFSANLLHIAESHNKDVDGALTLSLEDKRMLREAWENVLVQYDEISDKLTPEVQLVIAHLQVGYKMYSQTSELKENAMSTMSVIRDALTEMGAVIRESYKKGDEKNAGEPDESAAPTSGTEDKA